MGWRSPRSAPTGRPLLRAAAAGPSPARVINIGSIDGLSASAFDAWSYGASKAAVHHLTRFMASRLTKQRIVFNAIAPGPYPIWMLSTGVGFGGKTEGEGVDWASVDARNPSGRVGTAQDIAGLATFLCSRAGQYVAGQVIASDGGMVAAALAGRAGTWSYPVGRHALCRRGSR